MNNKTKAIIEMIKKTPEKEQELFLRNKSNYQNKLLDLGCSELNNYISQSYKNVDGSSYYGYRIIINDLYECFRTVDGSLCQNYQEGEGVE